MSTSKSYHEDPDAPSRNKPNCAAIVVVTSFDKDVDYIITNRVIRRKGSRLYKILVKVEESTKH